MENSQNERISEMIAAGVEPSIAVQAVQATDAIEAAKAAVAARNADRPHADKVADEYDAEISEIHDAYQYGRMTFAQQSAEIDLVKAYATIARDTGATIEQVRDVARSLGTEHHTNLSPDELVEAGYISESERDDLVAERADDLDERFAQYDAGVMAHDPDDEPEPDVVDDDFPMWLEYNDIEGLTAPMEFDDPYEPDYGLCDGNPE